MIAGVGIVARQHGVFTPAVGTACILIGLAQLVPLGVPFSDGGLFDPGRGLLGVFVPFGGLLVWAVLMITKLWGPARRGAAIAAVERA